MLRIFDSYSVAIFFPPSFLRRCLDGILIMSMDIVSHGCSLYQSTLCDLYKRILHHGSGAANYIEHFPALKRLSSGEISL